MSTIGCSECLSKCKADCCSSLVPIPISTWLEHGHMQAKMEISVSAIPTKDGKPSVMVHTADGKCVFLKRDLSCAIYDHRPKVCQLFGTGLGMYGEKSNLMRCSHLENK